MRSRVTRYFSGKPCPKGHVAERMVCNGCCVLCVKDWARLKRANNPEWAKKSLKERRARQRKNNPERFEAANIKWKGLRKRLTKEWRLKNAKRHRVNCRNRYILKSGAEGRYTIDDINGLYVNQNGKCFCNKDLNRSYHVDHILPLSRGGFNWPSNLQLLCEKCNTSKGSKTMEEWCAKQKSP